MPGTYLPNFPHFQDTLGIKANLQHNSRPPATLPGFSLPGCSSKKQLETCQNFTNLRSSVSEFRYLSNCVLQLPMPSSRKGHRLNLQITFPSKGWQISTINTIQQLDNLDKTIGFYPEVHGNQTFYSVKQQQASKTKSTRQSEVKIQGQKLISLWLCLHSFDGFLIFSRFWVSMEEQWC